MGLFSKDYESAGVGISKNAPKKKGAALFFDIVGRKFWKLLALNFIYMLFFIPMQVGGREGGFALSAKGLAIPAGYGFFVGLICRVRELIWTVIGMSLMKVGNRTK